MLSDDLSRLMDAPVHVDDSTPLSGGCISEVKLVTLGAGHGLDLPDRLVIKRNSTSMAANFRCEFLGLQTLADVASIRVPRPIRTGVVGNNAYLLMEYIESGPSREAFENFGRRLAKLHRVTAGQDIGWNEDNFLGAAPQKNRSCDSWTEFFATRRIEFQIRWASDQGLADAALKSDCQMIIDRMESLLSGRTHQTSLLHGDLWSGNYLFDSAGEPVLLDPAVYRGCREAEWGMIRLFGSCPPVFERGYQEEWPMPDGWNRRVNVYRLYHELNHLNLFGASYLGSCRSTTREILSC